MVTISSALSSSSEVRMRFSRSLSGAALRGCGGGLAFLTLAFAGFFAGAFLTAFLPVGFLAAGLAFFFLAGLRAASSG
jgi:hypothetical protein